MSLHRNYESSTQSGATVDPEMIVEAEMAVRIVPTAAKGMPALTDEELSSSSNKNSVGKPVPGYY